MGNPGVDCGRYTRGWGGECSPTGWSNGPTRLRRTPRESVSWGRGRPPVLLLGPQAGGWKPPPFCEGDGAPESPRDWGGGAEGRGGGAGPRVPAAGRAPLCSPAALAPVLTSFPFWLLRSERADVGESGKGGRAGAGGGDRGAEKPGRGLGWRPTGTAARDPRCPHPSEQVRARAPGDPAGFRTRDPLIPQYARALPQCALIAPFPASLQDFRRVT